ncbi:MAG TPA: hypothetical protein VNL18_15610 [Gemmatimonadales bacterium]|nr:hypothetical protein [Gemmatimonadales bacterium]
MSAPINLAEYILPGDPDEARRVLDREILRLLALRDALDRQEAEP